ncbi:GH36-type glycosyl hydrolase domain-containing protein [Methylobacter sp. YRD-M1]|uniref:GH36-type glycosyl hydrolase domain-containing protein n=1 Tax=Methylobacter sp. YRD-M1 TaxID=2911520 RepID=UPI002279F501|nr:glucoamylase family protein [Methylobacter sp. YRD-M1]WAK03588.1 cyclic beta 1-2 glucan synthetase [Methylobacter sp. YRD-M1]
MFKEFGFSTLERHSHHNGRDTDLLRSELFSVEQLKRYAVALAGQHRISPRPGPDRLLPRLADNERVLLAAYDVVTAAVNEEQHIASAEAWLLDNFYLIEQQIHLARRHLPRTYSRELPQLAAGQSAGFPRIYELALELISHQDGRVDSENATHFIDAYQTVEPLKLGELWAFPIMLRLALLENLRRVGLRIARGREEYNTAVMWADRMLDMAEKDPKQLAQLLAEFAAADVPLTAAFVEEFNARLQIQGTALAFVQTWIDNQLLEQGVNAAQLIQDASHTAAANQISIANSIGSLRFISSMDWRDFVEAHSAVEQILRKDPAGMHGRQNFATRDLYRHIIEKIAKGSVHSESDVAREAVAFAQAAAERLTTADRSSHVGFYLIDKGRYPLERKVDYHMTWMVRAFRALRRFRLTIYIGSILLLTAVMTSIVLMSLNGLDPGNWQFWFFAVCSMIGGMALAVPLVNQFAMMIVPPRMPPRLDFSRGIPPEYRTMVVVPTLLNKPQDVDDLVEAMEIRYLGNRDPNLFFALLTDFSDAPEQTQPGDEELLTLVRTAVETLNATYRNDRPCIFYLFHRPRVWNPHERVWMGYERKRGKLEQFNAVLRGDGEAVFSELVGDPSILPSIKYVITLDTDTQLPRDAAHMLVGNIAHPLNRPIYNNAKRRITDGYAILQPRASISLFSASQSRFTRLFAGEAGIDPYTREVSDVYQDIFGEGSFIGKGIYDVDAFRLTLEGRFPENLILSHDLLESGHARSGLVSDVDLIEEHPTSYAMEASRRHRWIRGDWQLVSWLLPKVPGPDGKRQPNPLSPLSIWKIFDNLRRSLVPPALLALLAGGWLFGPMPAWFWTLLVTVILFFQPLLEAGIELIRKPGDREWLEHFILVNKSTTRPVLLAVLALVLLPYDTLICLDAILSSAGRMPFTRRGLLLWHTDSYVRRNTRRTLVDFFLEMWIAPVMASGLAVALAFAWDGTRWTEWLLTAPVLLIWLVSPAIGWWISKPLAPPAADLTAGERIFLRSLARRTWRYFAQFVAPLDNWLPPDNFQEYPDPVIASRTSPTNMGMALAANLAAYDFGYISAGELLYRTENTVATMEKLERYQHGKGCNYKCGHFYNWYDTRTLQPLHPQYVSSVDSGNLVGSLLTLQTGLAELKSQPVLSANVFQGLEDTFQVLLAEYGRLTPTQTLTSLIQTLQHVFAARKSDSEIQTLVEADAQLEKIQHAAAGLFAALSADTESELHYWAQALDHQAGSLREDLNSLVPDLRHFSAIPTLQELAETGETDAEPVAGMHHKLAKGRIRFIGELIERCRRLADMDFKFLYDTKADLLAIGYDVGERRRDPACYDLLASEARLVSFLLIAQGQLPQRHWFTLGRLLTSQGSDVSLISWSGSMFEYLMPQLIMPSYQNTLLEQTCRAAVSRQIEYGRQRNVPWGISESCYNLTDMHQTYQYRAFGVPGLGFKRGLGDDLVIAPYATALALTVTPQSACRNLQTLVAHGFLGCYGLYEAIDYTPTRVMRGKNCAIVRNFMAHHQGMSLLAFEHVLLDRPMQRRFMSDPLVRATDLLLQERVPKKGYTLHPHAAEVSASARPPVAEEGEILRVFIDPNTPIPEVHLLSNGRYHVMATQAGGGYSRWHDLAVTRWREDTTADNWGAFIYLRDLDTREYWSSAYHPTLRKADHYEAIFVQSRAEYRRRDQNIEAHTEISVSPEDDVEIRRVTLTNLSLQERHIEVTSYAEVVLAPLNADLAHRVFSNLFVQTEILPERQAILCTRRRRTPEEHTPWMFHLITVTGTTADEPSYETDRAQFIGRGRTAANPAVFDDSDRPLALSNTEGPVLDPIIAIRQALLIEPDGSAVVKIITGAADTREAVLELIDKYRDRHFIERAFEMAWFHSQEVLRHLNASESDAQIFGRLATSVIYSNALRRAPPSVIARNQLGQPGLWPFAVSGDWPIVLVRIGDVSRIDLVRQMLQAHAYWRVKGLTTDLVILNEDFSGYRAVLHDQIMGLINIIGNEAQVLDKPGGVFVRRAEDLSEEDRVLFQTVARVMLTDTAGSLAEQVEQRVASERLTERRKRWRQGSIQRRMLTEHFPEALVPVREPAFEPSNPLPARERIFFNGLGGFTPDGREYVITLEPGQNTPAPWANVIASPYIGTVVSESGGAYTWVENAHEFRLTPFHNDPLSDSSGEAFYVRDEETGEFWSPTPLPARGRSGYVCRHGFGYSTFEHFEAGIYSELTTYVAMDAPVKFAVVKLRNASGRYRRLSLTGYWELVMGEWRHANQMHIVTETDHHSGALFARNAYGRESAHRVVFVQISEFMHTVTGNRMEFIGRNGSLTKPAALSRTHLSGKTGAGLDPCAAMQTHIELEDGQEREIVFVIGAGRDTEGAQQLIQRFGEPIGAQQALEAVWAHWNRTLGSVYVETPDRALDVMSNGWLLYQVLSCRLWGRSGYYQSGGAYGFRDQLQDTMALIHATPWLAREQLLRCAGRQFIQGDVQHWWHPPGGQGVRTHFSDDYLWLPYATCRYVSATGDTGVLDEFVHFLEGRELGPEEEAYYDLPLHSSEGASLYEHCVRAIKYGLRFGAHDLPLIGCGDWNDGMNLIGREGKGESVWLAWFLYDNLRLFAELARNRGDEGFAEICRERAGQLLINIEANAWDGDWYRRAYFDDGTPLGSASNDECQIDSISQSWAIISGGGNPERASQAMESVDERLVRRDAQIVQLLTPPFDKSDLEPGYIKGYVPGVRENGGQYTHAAIWTAMAFAMEGDKKRAWELFTMLNPVNRTGQAQQRELYKVEPYVIAADIYGAPPHTGRGGWTWYTGAAGWLYRLSVETLLGLQLKVDKLHITPCMPDHWSSYKIHYQYRDTLYRITIKRIGEKPEQVIRVLIDGVESEEPGVISLIDDRQPHDVDVEMGRR